METEKFIVGDKLLHLQLCYVTAVLSLFARVAPRSMDVEQISRRIQCPPGLTLALLRRLATAGLIVSDQEAGNKWHLPCQRREISLSNIYDFVLAEREELFVEGDIAYSEIRLDESVEIMWMQAALEINRCIASQLQDYPIFKLQHVPAKAIFPNHRYQGFRIRKLGLGNFDLRMINETDFNEF
ncbi:hypothetical protein ACFQUU_22805 [Herbaspirillum sp. GCM10030257]|uniref:hypothetical protein n=1 Tax=Herbaspirillum sp. GCM10030257 TaxID=3273393 RepID=UPI003612B2D3